MADIYQRIFKDKQVFQKAVPRSKPIHEDLEDCHHCGAPDHVWVIRNKKNYKDWQICSDSAFRKPGWTYPMKVSIDSSGAYRGLCRSCKIEKLKIDQIGKTLTASGNEA